MLVNDRPYGFFSSSHGLRHLYHNSISPFIIVVDYLSWLLTNSKGLQAWHTFIKVLSCISHLQMARNNSFNHYFTALNTMRAFLANCLQRQVILFCHIGWLSVRLEDLSIWQAFVINSSHSLIWGVSLLKWASFFLNKCRKEWRTKKGTR